MKKQIVIVVPIYKSVLNALERISLHQLFTVLGKGNIIYYVVPQSLKIDAELPVAGVIRFEDSYFKSTATYSSLLLSLEFYQRFIMYKYLLIYQLDAFVFMDKLKYFCSLNYDYIGAPTPKLFWRDLKNRVGNGGFSLRKISSTIKVLEIKQDVLRKAKLELPHYLYHELVVEEDKFFAYCGSCDIIPFRVPSINVARQFSVEYDVAHAYKSMERGLPFGCHRWYSDNFDVWWPIIKRYGYTLSNAEKRKFTCSGKYKKARALNAGKYLCYRILKAGDEIRLRNCCNMFLDLEESYSIWGYGKIGKRCLALLRQANMKIFAIYDTNVGSEKQDGNIPVLCPNEDLLLKKTSKILISTTKYQNEIQKKLEALGLEQGKDYYIFADLEHKICCGYYSQNR